MTFKTFLNEDSSQLFADVHYDNRKGWGAVPNNQDIGYFGLEFVMHARKFLELALPLPRDQAESVDSIKQHLLDGGAIGTPFLEVQLEDRDGPLDVPRIMGHEGRNRVYAIMELFGDDHEIIVHVFPRGGMRRRDITSDMIEGLMHGAYAERSNNLITDPFIKLK